MGKLVGGSLGVLLSLQEYGWKTPENFDQVGEAFADNKSVLIAKMDTSDVKDNKEFKPEKTPTLRYYAPGSTTGIDFVGDADSAEAVTEFVQFQLDPKLKQLKDLAQQFAKASGEARDKLLKQTESLVDSLDESFQRTGKLYLVLMKRVIAKGDEFIASEKKRVQGLIDNSKSVTAEKIKDFKRRLSVLDVFGKEA